MAFEARMPSASEIATSSLHDEILTKLRDFIIESDMAAGTRIPERQLCEKFGISRTPLREALKVLAAEGFIELLPNRGARVRILSERDIDELFDLMAGLEALAGRLACERITDAEVARIETLHQTMYIAYLHSDLPGYLQTNRLIHQEIVKAARNTALSAAHAGYSSHIRRIRYGAGLAKKRSRWAAAVREHEAILDALHRRAGAELSDILFVHLRNRRLAALAHLAENEAAAVGPAASSESQEFILLAEH